MRPPSQAFLALWDPVVVVAATAAAVLVPARVIVGHDLVPWFAVFEFGFTVLFLIDFFIRLQLRRERTVSRRRILLACDLLSALPFLFMTGIGALALLRLLKLPRLVSLMAAWRHRHLEHWNILRLVYFVYWLALCVHWLACGWLALRGIPSGEDVTTAYVQSLYWCFSTLTTMGYTDNVPRTNPEILYSILVMIFGVGTYGYVIGNVATILVNIDPARAGYYEHMEKLSSFMNYRGVPPELQRRVRDYHTYVWEHRLGYDEKTILGRLPPALMAEMSIFLKRDIIQHVPFFATASDELLADIGLVMESVVFMPGDVIFREGERGDAMYFVSKGEVEVFRNTGEFIAVLKKGEAFGEMALLLGKPRVASVRARGFCDLYKLDQRAFSDILERYPEFRSHIRSVTKGRQNVSRTLRT